MALNYVYTVNIGFPREEMCANKQRAILLSSFFTDRCNPKANRLCHHILHALWCSVRDERLVCCATPLPGVPDEQLSSKKRTWEQIQPDLYTDENKVATYKGTPFKVEGKGVCVAPTLSKTPIK